MQRKKPKKSFRSKDGGSFCNVEKCGIAIKIGMY